MIWQLQEAKNNFSPVVNRALHEGPQVVTRHGQEVVVILSIDKYKELTKSQPSLLELLLNPPLAGSGIEITRDREDFGR